MLAVGTQHVEYFLKVSVLAVHTLLTFKFSCTTLITEVQQGYEMIISCISVVSTTTINAMPLSCPS